MSARVCGNNSMITGGPPDFIADRQGTPSGRRPVSQLPRPGSGPTSEPAAGARFAAALRAVSESSGAVFVDLRAVGPLPRPVRRSLADADARLAAAGGALLVIDEETPVLDAHLLAR